MGEDIFVVLHDVTVCVYDEFCHGLNLLTDFVLI